MADRFQIRALHETDIPSILAYWRTNTDADLERLGELARPDETSNTEFLHWFCKTRPSVKEAGEDILIWEVDALSIGYCTLKDVLPGKDAQIHIHMWNKEMRGKGYGSHLFCLSALEFRKKYHLQELYCQPKADNPYPNGLLNRVGFKKVAEINWKRSDGSFIAQTRYLVDPQTALNYLNK